MSTNFFWLTSENFWISFVENISAVWCSELWDNPDWLPCSEDWIQTLEKNEWNIDSWISRKTFRESVIGVVNYFLILLWILGVVMIIYAWISVVVWWEDKQEDAKKTIFWVIIWFIIIFLSYSIVNFVWNIWQNQKCLDENNNWICDSEEWSKDFCSEWDKSPSEYDWTCWYVNPNEDYCPIEDFPKWDTSLSKKDWMCSPTEKSYDYCSMWDKSWSKYDWVCWYNEKVDEEWVFDWDLIYLDENWNPILTPEWKTIYIDKDWNKYYIDDNWNKVLVDENWNPILTPDWELIYLESVARIFVEWKEVRSVLRFNTLDSAVKWILFDPSKSVVKEWRDIEEYIWDFWDWNLDFYEDWEPVRQFYESAWKYNLKLSVRDSENFIVEKNIKVIIEDLTADIKINPSDIFLWAKVSFDWSDSKSSNWKISSYKWSILNSQWESIKKHEERNFWFTPKNAWKYKVELIVWNLKWKESFSEKTFTVDSNKPKALFIYSNKNISSPWIYIFDWGSSYDSDWDKLKYSWDFNWDWEYEIKNSNEFKTTYSYEEIWDYNVYLKVEDQFWEFDIFNQKVSVRSVLNVNFDVDRYASQKWSNINFTPIVPISVNSILWDFKDWKKETTAWLDKISHTFNESWIFTIKMTAVNRDWEENTVIKNVFIWDWEYPVWVFQTFVNWEKRFWKIDMCWEWRDWIEITRLDQIEVNAKDSINLDNTNWWLSYTWDFWDWHISETQVARHKYRLTREECYPIKISVKDNYSKKVAKLSDTMWVKVVNKIPNVWWLQLIADKNEDWEYVTPLKIKLNLNNTFDEDWNIVKYKWYYQKPFTEEKLWYTETFSKNVEFLIESDWIKWLTNDYVFNVEVEDNEWWANSLFATHWEINKISVKNWETKNLNLDFESNTTQGFTWEQIIFRVKNWLKTDWLFYSWDFNWDEEIDKTTQSKITEHSFSKKWVYNVELRVENNWVFERVYKTIYIDEKHENTSGGDEKDLNNLDNEDLSDKKEIISTDLWIKLKWEWFALTSLNVRVNKYTWDKYELIAHIMNSDSSLYEWKIEFQIINWNWEIKSPEINALNSIAKTEFIKTWEWIIEIKIIAKDTIYWDLEEKILIN
jgi:PKD repeat protein